METVTAVNGRVGHIVAGTRDTADGRVVDTLCGKTFLEVNLRVAESNICKRCERKVKDAVQDAVDEIVE